MSFLSHACVSCVPEWNVLTWKRVIAPSEHSTHSWWFLYGASCRPCCVTESQWPNYLWRQSHEGVHSLLFVFPFLELSLYDESSKFWPLPALFTLNTTRNQGQQMQYGLWCFYTAAGMRCLTPFHTLDSACLSTWVLWKVFFYFFYSLLLRRGLRRYLAWM